MVAVAVGSELVEEAFPQSSKWHQRSQTYRSTCEPSCVSASQLVCCLRHGHNEGLLNWEPHVQSRQNVEILEFRQKRGGQPFWQRLHERPQSYKDRADLAMRNTDERSVMAANATQLMSLCRCAAW